MTKNYKDILDVFLDIDAEKGLPEDVFLAVSAVIPIVNVDLLIFNKEEKILLAWRDDEYFGRGWHIPGGCVRYKETLLERVQKTALQEIGAEVSFNPVPIAVEDVILGKNDESKRIRAHHLAVLYSCRVNDGFSIDNRNLDENSPGYLKWFDKIPINILRVHDVYHNIFESYGLINV